MVHGYNSLVPLLITLVTDTGSQRRSVSVPTRTTNRFGVCCYNTGKEDPNARRKAGSKVKSKEETGRQADRCMNMPQESEHRQCKHEQQNKGGYSGT